MNRQAEIEAIASALMDANPGLTAARAVQIAGRIINELQRYARCWDRDAAIAYALRQPVARTV